MVPSNRVIDFVDFLDQETKEELSQLLTHDPTLDPIHEVNMALNTYKSYASEDNTNTHNDFAAPLDRLTKAKTSLKHLTEVKKIITDFPNDWPDILESSNYFSEDRIKACSTIDVMIAHLEYVTSTPPKRGRRVDHAKNNLHAEWIAIYTRGAGKAPTITTNPVAEPAQYTGAYIDLTTKIFQLISYTPSPSEIKNHCDKHRS